MTKILRAAIFFAILSLTLGEGYSQLNRKNIKKNNKRMSNFKGKKNTFDKNKRYNYIGFTVNSLNYFGDLSPLSKALSTDISFTRPGFGLTFAHRFGPRYTFRGDFMYGTLSGSDFESADPSDEIAKFRYVRNLHFRNRIKELTLTAVFDLFKNEASYITRAAWTPYAYLGLSVLHHNPKAYVAEDSGLPEAGSWVELKPLGTEGQNGDILDTDVNAGIKPYKNIQIAIPFGIGIRYKLNQAMDLSFEMGTRYLFFDYIDDVSANYVDVSRFSDPLAAYMSDRSRELTDAVTGDVRDAAIINDVTGGTVGQATPFSGYGTEFRDNVRGNKNDNDVYMVATIRVTYILGGKFMKAKFR